MFKVMTVAKRKPGITLEEYRKRYEEGHAPLGVKLVGPGLRRYVRNYVVHPENGPEFDFDSITEYWWSSENARNAWRESYLNDEVGAEMVADEEGFMDRSTMRIAVVEEVEEIAGL